MAACAACGDACVIHRCTSFEASGAGVAAFTFRSGCNVGAWLANGFCAVVASGTACGDASMAHRGWLERCRVLMTGFTSSCRWDVGRGFT